MKVLYTTPILEHPAAGGPQLRVENSIRALNRVSELFIMSRVTRRGLGGLGAEEFFRSHCRLFDYTQRVSGVSDHKYLGAVQRWIRRALAVSDAESLLAACQHLQIDVLWFGYGNISANEIRAIKRMSPTLPVVYDTDSVWSRFILRGAAHASSVEAKERIRSEGRLKQDEEREMVNLCDITSAVSEVDAEYYRSIARNPERVKIFSNVVCCQTYELIPPAPLQFKRPNMYLAGTFGPGSPMDHAARWLIQEVLPAVAQEVPEIRLYIVGRNSLETLKDIKDPRVTVVGTVDSVLPYLGHANVAVVPLAFESGTRFKILEAGACGIPIVSTTVGAEGLPVVHGQHLLIADKVADFSRAVVSLLQDDVLARRLSQNCQMLVRECFSLDSLAREAREILEYLRSEK